MSAVFTQDESAYWSVKFDALLSVGSWGDDVGGGGGVSIMKTRLTCSHMESYTGLLGLGQLCSSLNSVNSEEEDSDNYVDCSALVIHSRNSYWLLHRKWGAGQSTGSALYKSVLQHKKRTPCSMYMTCFIDVFHCSSSTYLKNSSGFVFSLYGWLGSKQQVTN